MALTHPEFSRTRIGGATQKELADLGVFIEKCRYNVAENETTAAEMAAHSKETGTEHCFMTNDRGQQGRETPVEGMKRFIAARFENDLSEDEIYTMTHTVPEQVIKE